MTTMTARSNTVNIIMEMMAGTALDSVEVDTASSKKEKNRNLN